RAERRLDPRARRGGGVFESLERFLRGGISKSQPAPQMRGAGALSGRARSRQRIAPGGERIEARRLDAAGGRPAASSRRASILSPPGAILCRLRARPERAPAPRI